MRERSRKVLARELSTRPRRDFDFAALVAEHAMPRYEADAAAALECPAMAEYNPLDSDTTPEQGEPEGLGRPRSASEKPVPTETPSRRAAPPAARPAAPCAARPPAGVPAPAPRRRGIS